MASKKQKLGFDPLSWMQEGEAEEKEAPAKNKVSKAAASTKNVIGLEADILRDSFNLIAP